MIATKGGLTRPGPGSWTPNGDPEYLVNAAHKSRERLGWKPSRSGSLHRIDPKVPRGEQFAAIKSLIDDGVIAHAGLSEVSVDDIKAAQKVFRVATVQNRYNLVDRQSEDVLEYCEKHAIGFIPWFPLAAGDLAEPGGALDRGRPCPQRNARARSRWPGCSKRSPVMLPIPGTSKAANIWKRICAAAAVITLVG